MKNFIIIDNKKINNLIITIFLFTLLYFFYLFIYNEIQINLFLSIIFLFFIHYTLFYIYFSSKKELDYIPIYPFICFFYWFTFSLYFYFNQNLEPIRVDNKYFIYPEIIPLIKIFSLGLVCFAFGYFVLNLLSIKKFSLKLNQINMYEKYVILSFILLIFFYYINYELELLSFSIFSQLKQPLILFLLCYFQIKYLVTGNIIFFFSLIILLFLLFTIEVSFGATVFPFLMISALLLLSFYKKRKINLIFLLLISLSIYCVHSLKNTIRLETWVTYLKQNQDKSLSHKFEHEQSKNREIFYRLKKSADIYINESDLVLDKNKLNTFKRRLFHSNETLQIVINQTPDKINFYNGESYKNIIYKFIPRILNKNKPIEEWGNFWGKRYGILSNNDNVTSWNFPILSEFYANYGIKGIIFGMFFLGIMIKLFVIFFSFNFTQPLLLSMSSTIILNFFFLESNLSLIIGKVFNEMLFFSMVILLILFLNFSIKRLIFLK